MAIDLGFSGQESDVNRACSAFGLDTLNYRAFPNNGPVPAPAAVVSVEPTQPLSPIDESPRIVAAPVAVEQQQPAPQPIPWVSPRPEFSPPQMPFTPMPAAPLQSAPGPALAFTAAPAIPPGHAPTFHPHPPNGSPAAGQAAFALLAQALAPNAARAGSMPAFAMSRAALLPLQQNGWAPQENPAPRPTASNPESFGVAFGAAFNAAFGSAAASANPQAAANFIPGFHRPPG